METRRYAYNYAIIGLDTGKCTHVQDTTDYILDRAYVPIDEALVTYLGKYYYPIPESVSSFNDFQGKWYTDASHTTEWTPS